MKFHNNSILRRIVVVLLTNSNFFETGGAIQGASTMIGFAHFQEYSSRAATQHLAEQCGRDPAPPVIRIGPHEKQFGFVPAELAVTDHPDYLCALQRN